MPKLVDSLSGRDLGHLRIVAQFWGVELDAPDVRTGLAQLSKMLLDPQKVSETVAGLPPEERAALDELLGRAGRMPWAQFTRRYGELREIGPARRDREQPHLDPISPVEALWYRALVGRVFFDTPVGPEEFAYIPEDLLPLLSARQAEPVSPLGRPAWEVEYAHISPANDRILDHACTMLAALRLGISISEPFSTSPASIYPLTAGIMSGLLASANLLDDHGLPHLERARAFLEAGRGEALSCLVRAWKSSPSFNELHLIPDLSCEGLWLNDALHARQMILGWLAHIPVERWWSLGALIADVRQQQPDFQRPGGDYDSWFVRDLRTGSFLRGFENWEAVDGALLRFIFTGPMHWLGLLDLASASPGAPASAFRTSKWAVALLNEMAPLGLEGEGGKIQARSDARLMLPRLAPRAIRYQIARFGVWEKATDETYTYRLTPHSLQGARQQGLGVSHLLSLLRRHAETVPPSLGRALERWERHGTEARLEQAWVLRLASPEMMQTVRSSRAGRFLGDLLGPTVVMVKPGAAEKVLAVLAELGYMGDIE